MHKVDEKADDDVKKPEVVVVMVSHLGDMEMGLVLLTVQSNDLDMTKVQLD